MHDLLSSLPLPPLLVWTVALALGLTLLVKSSDAFTGAAEVVGRAAGMSSFVIGVTIVALGTSLPELVSSVVAVLGDASEIVAGNVVGSNIANLLFILGLAAVIDGNLSIKRRISRVDLPFLMGSTFLLAMFLWRDGVGRVEAAFCIAGLGLYLHYALRAGVLDGELGEEAGEPSGSRGGARAAAILVVTAALIYLSADLSITAVTELGAEIGVGSEVIAASAVAFGTSLPEASVTIAAARRRNCEMAVGNVLGSNVFNSFAVIGVSALVGPLTVAPSMHDFAIPVMLLATIFVYLAIMEREISRWEGWLMLGFYLYFTAALFGLA